MMRWKGAEREEGTQCPCDGSCLDKETSVRFIPKAIHGVADYLVGLVLILVALLAPLTGAMSLIYGLLGLFAIVYALLTDYPLGWKPILTMPTHLVLDAAFCIVMFALAAFAPLPEPLVWLSAVIGAMAAFCVATTRME
jgi:hypothetical protein